MAGVLRGEEFGEHAWLEHSSDMDDGQELLFDFSEHPEQGFERALDCWSKLDSKGRLILQRDGRLIACSGLARRIIDDRDCLRLEHGFVAPVDSRYRASFDKLLMVNAQGVETLLHPCLRTGGHWIFRATASEDRRVFVTLQQAAPDHHAKLVDLREAFGLTRSEAEVADALYNGLSAHDVADKLDISIHTVRAHLRRCYDKMHINSREQFWHRVSAYQL